MLLRRLPKSRPRGFATRLDRYHHPPRQTRFYSSSGGGGSGNNAKNSGAGGDRSNTGPWAVGAVGLAVGFYYWNKNRGVQNEVALPGTVPKTVPDLDKLKQPGDEKISYGPVPTSEDVTRQLNDTTWSYPETGSGAVSRYDGAQLGSNSPCEDAYLHGRLANPLAHGQPSFARDWMAWAVFDGHCGWQMSDLLTRELIPAVRNALCAVPKSPTAAGPDPEATIHRALKDAFTGLDDKLVKTAAATIESADLSFPEKARRLEAAYAGACALLALFDPGTRTLRVASTGDCRAVLGRRPRSDAQNRWEATELTTDHTGANPDEEARIRAAFPDEPNIVAGGRVWGMQPSRTFGDGMVRDPSTFFSPCPALLSLEIYPLLEGRTKRQAISGTALGAYPWGLHKVAITKLTPYSNHSGSGPRHSRRTCGITSTA